ncbi:hypothetical protein B0H14DRAFT_2653856 [Mycena olivaceomarginata]|nr:hypothetical protein B0H14DRAFT_2653856 [Mycena olivaceomarginata]
MRIRHEDGLACSPSPCVVSTKATHGHGHSPTKAMCGCTLVPTMATCRWAPASTKAMRGWDQSPTKMVYGRSYTPTKTPQITGRRNGVTVNGNMWDVGLALGKPLCDTYGVSVRALCDPCSESARGQAQIWCGSRSSHGCESAATALCRVATASGAESRLIQTNP